MVKALLSLSWKISITQFWRTLKLVVVASSIVQSQPFYILLVRDKLVFSRQKPPVCKLCANHYVISNNRSSNFRRPKNIRCVLLKYTYTHSITIPCLLMSRLYLNLCIQDLLAFRFFRNDKVSVSRVSHVCHSMVSVWIIPFNVSVHSRRYVRSPITLYVNVVYVDPSKALNDVRTSRYSPRMTMFISIEWLFCWYKSLGRQRLLLLLWTKKDVRREFSDQFIFLRHLLSGSSRCSIGVRSFKQSRDCNEHVSEELWHSSLGDAIVKRCA